MKNIGLLAVAILMLLSSCDSYTTSGALLGGMFGSAVGRMAGGYYGGDVGTIVGTAVGAAAGAAVRDAEERRAAYYYDDVYAAPRKRDAKAERVARYHAKTKAKYSDRGYVLSERNGFSLTKPAASRSVQSQQDAAPKDSSGYTKDATYDDRIEFK